MSSFKYLPFRTFADFVLDKDKYGVPAVHDLEKFNNRVVSNLLYYQTNYIAFTLATVSLFLFMGFSKLILGGIAIVPAAALVLRQFGKTRVFDKIQAQNPNAIVLISLVELVILYLLYNQVWYFCLAMSLPLGFTILHAAFRKRSIKNMVNNKVDQVSGAVYENTPMEHLLKTLGVRTVNVNEKD